MTKLSFEQKVIVSDDVLFQILAGETVLLNMETEQYFALNEIGSKIWELISKEKNISEVFTKLLNEYEVEYETLKNDFSSLLLKMESKKLITFEN
jgi:hypothetical protein